MSQLNSPPDVKDIGGGLLHGQDGLPLRNGPLNVIDDAIFAELDYLRMAKPDIKRWSNCRDRLASQG